MTSTYKAVEVSAPGVLRVVERPVPEPGAGQVRIRVDACGICHTDASTVTGSYPGLQLPRVPGHEEIETEDALAFSVLENIRPMIETRPLEEAADAYARMMDGKARFRMMLTMNAALDETADASRH
jgi:D-arabinose 1-dehydrogenase-like Zn-dependent alcohol dehydrogenase